MRKYRNMEQERWRQILRLLRQQLDARIMEVQRMKGRERVYEVSLSFLQEAYDNSRFLHQFLGYEKATKLEKIAEELLSDAGE